jgi:hypothetical protein
VSVTRDGMLRGVYMYVRIYKCICEGGVGVGDTRRHADVCEYVCIYMCIYVKVGSVSVTRDGMLIVPAADSYILAISLANWKEVCVLYACVCACVHISIYLYI